LRSRSFTPGTTGLFPLDQIHNPPHLGRWKGRAPGPIDGFADSAR
jgi:hypothetical protein